MYVCFFNATYNRPKLLENIINHIKKECQNNVFNVKHIIVDDCSTQIQEYSRLINKNKNNKN